MSTEESTRLFVGGLSQQLPEEELNQQLSNFGTVKKLEIKEKKDLCSGEVIKRFAFATLDSSRSRIDQCIRSLHGKTLHGSELTLERAQESFIDRLNREREARAQGKTIDKNTNSQHQQGNQNDYQFNFGGGEDTNTRYNNNEEDYSWQRPAQSVREDSSQHGGQKRGRGWEEEEDKQKVPEELFPSSVWQENREEQQQGRWGDQGDDRRGADESSQYRAASPPPQKWAKIAPRYDPKKKNSAAAAPANSTTTAAATQSGETPQQLPKAVLVPTTVSADLTFTGASQGFSLLSMLEQAEPVTVVAKDAEEETDATTQEQKDVTQENDEQKQRDLKPLPEPVVPVAEKKQPTAVKTYIKKSKFFVDIDDPEVEENLRWVYREIPESQLVKFRNDRPEIMKLYSDRHRKAQAELRQSLPGAGSNTNKQSWSGEVNDGEDAVMAVYDNDGPDPVALATDSFRGASQGALQSVVPVPESSEGQDGGARRGGGGAGMKGKGRDRRPPASSGRGRGGGGGRDGGGGRGRHANTRGKEGRGRCPG